MSKGMKRAASAALAAVAAGLAWGAPLAGAMAQGMDLRAGAVFTMSNARDGNEVRAFARLPNGALRRFGSFATGGTGSGSFEDSDNSIILGTAAGEASPNNVIEDARLLFVANPGSDTITVFRIRSSGLERVGVTPSGGEKPVSLTVSRGVLYVLNSGEPTDDLVDSTGEFIPNCTTGTPSITGFRVSPQGRLTPIPGSLRRLSGLGGSGCAQVSFTPDGEALVVTERLALDRGVPGNRGDEGVILGFSRNADGTLSDAPRITLATGSGPFGFGFSKAGDLYVTEQFDGILGPGEGAAAPYRVGRDGKVIPTGGSVGNGGTDTCWFVVTDDGRYGYAASFFRDGRISVYGLEGGFRLLEADASPAVRRGSADLALSRDSAFLYNVNALEGTITAFRVRGDGGLDLVQEVTAAAPSAMGRTIGLAAF